GVTTARHIVAAVFGVSITFLIDFDGLTRRINVGDCDDTLDRFTKDEQKAAMDAVMVSGEHFFADLCDSNSNMIREQVVSVPNTGNIVANAANNGLGTSPKEIQSLLEKFSIDMSNLAHNSFGGEQFAPSMPQANFRSISFENLCDGVNFSILRKVVEKVSTQFNNTLYGYFIGKRVAFPVVEYYVRNNWDFDGLTRRINVGDCDDTLDRFTKDERKAAMDAVMVSGEHFFADLCDSNSNMIREQVVSVPNTGNIVANAANNGLGTSPKEIQSLLEKFLIDMSNLVHNSFGGEQFAPSMP
ncbi:hypothetical protein Tco_0378791, partial [Tanacetum coccineum]